MATIKKPVSKPTPAPTAVKLGGKQATPAPVTAKTKVAPKAPEGFEVMDMSNIQLVPKGGGGGRELSPFSAAVFGLEVGQGIRLSDEQYNGGKGVASLYAGAKRRGIKLRTRRDTKGQLWIFRVESPAEEEAAEELAEE